MKKTSWVSKLTSTVAAGAAAFMLFASFASAHVTVNPSNAQTGAWQMYTIKVPSEKELPTTKITLKVPKEVTFKQYQPLTGWKISTEKNESNEVTSITWEVDGDNQGILAGQFQQFNFVAQNPKNEAEVAWDAFQYYSDGSIVEWTGKPGDNNPHSITTISEDPAVAGNAAASDGHDSSGTAGAGHDSAGTAGSTSGSASNDTASDTATDGKKANDDTTLGDALSDTVTGQPNNTDTDTGTLKLQQATLIVSILALIMSFLGIALATRRKKR
ncbi:YcnI family protein [Paenibacillus silvae]|nr:YcnI family protein [Paenibacillus silvae]